MVNLVHKFISLSDKIKFSGLSEKNNFLVFIGGCVVIIIVMTFFMIHPYILEINQINNEVNLLKQKLENQQTKSPLNETLKSYNESKEKIAIMQDSILTKNRELEFIMALEEVANKNNLAQRISLGEATETPNKKFYTMPLQLWLEGDYSDELNYIEEIEILPFYINMKKINISSVKKENSATSTTNMFINAETFWQ